MKKDLIIDFDNTIANSSKRVYDMYLEKNPDKVTDLFFNKEALKWNFEPYVTDEEGKKECISYFSSKEMYEKLEWLDPYVEDALKELSKNYNIIICSRREKDAYTPLIDWLEKNMPCEYQTCFVSSYDKGMVGRRGSIIIDDKPICLLNNKDRSKKILIGKWGYQKDDTLEMDYNTLKDLYRNLVYCNDWKAVLEELR